MAGRYRDPTQAKDGLSGPPNTVPSTVVAKKKVNPHKVKQMEERLREVEREIAAAEKDVAACELELQSFESAEETIRLNKLLERRRGELPGLIREWEELSQALV